MALTERLCVYAKYIDADWVDQGVLDVIKTRFWSFIPRNGSGRTDAPQPIRRDLVAGAVREGPRRASSSRRRSSRRCSPRPGRRRSRTSARRRTSCAPSWRGTRSRSSSTATSTSRTSASSAARSAASGRASARPTPTSTTTPTSSPASTRPSSTGRPSCASSRASIRTGRSRTTSATCASRRRPRRSCTCTRTRRWRSRTSATSPGSRPSEVFEQLREAGLGLHARHRRRGAPRRRAPAHLAEQAAGRAVGRGHRGVAPHRAAVDGDGDVRAHRGAVGARRAHARRALAPGADRRLHGVRAALVHPVPHAARAGRTGSRRSPARRTSSTPPCSGSRWARPSRRCRRPG